MLTSSMHLSPLLKDIHRFTAACVFLIFIVCISGCDQASSPVPPLTLGGLTMGTTYSIKINEPDIQLSIEKINTDVNSILLDINNKMSTYIDDSELSIINQTSGNEWIPVSADLHQVISHAVEISNLTIGSFDITVGPLVNLWGFGPSVQGKKIPNAADISEALSRTGVEHINLRSSPLTLQKTITDIYIDLSGIAKGYAVDKIAEYLEQQNINNYMVEIGGEIRASGVNEIDFAWRIGIEKPVSEQRAVQRVIKLDNIAMATSGDYRNYFEEDGKRYSHTIDPRTGRPITHTLASVTVLHSSASWADALATAFLVMGKEAAYKIARQEDLPVLFLVRTEAGFTESYTDAFAGYLLDK
jgi:FAD:protein FMN transferase